MFSGALMPRFQRVTVPWTSIVYSALSDSAPVRMVPAHGPYLAGSLGTVITPSKKRLSCASWVAAPAELTRQIPPWSVETMRS